MGNFSFGKINVNSKRQVLNVDLNTECLLVDKSNSRASYNRPIAILLEEHYKQTELDILESYLRSLGCTRYIIFNSLNCDIPNEKDIKREGIISFYKNNRSNFFDRIPKGSNIITSGQSLYALLLENDVYPNYMNQRIFGKSNFWFSPDLTQEHCHRVYPVESFKQDIFGYSTYKKFLPNPIDSYKSKLAEVQISNAIDYADIELPEYPTLNKVYINSKEEFYTKFYLPNKDRKGEVLAWDTETSSLDFLRAEIGCITLSFDGRTGYYIPWKYVNKKQLGEILKNNRQLGQNLKYDIKLLWRPEKVTEKIEGYLIVEINNKMYKIPNSMTVKTSNRGFVQGRDLKEEDTIEDTSLLEEYVPIRGVSNNK